MGNGLGKVQGSLRQGVAGGARGIVGGKGGMDGLVKNAISNWEVSSRACPVVSECWDIGEGIA